MKSLKHLLVFLLIGLSLACQDDTDRIIQTNLPDEALQLFDVSSVLGETTPLASFSFSDFRNLSSENLPGCPLIELDLNLQQVLLNYDERGDCEGEPNHSRKGKILIDFSNQSGLVRKLFYYENYSFESYQLQGIREFTQSTLSNFTETFENLRLESEQNLGFIISGEFTHQINRTSFIPQSITSSGNLTGRNPTGRTLRLNIATPKFTELRCYAQDQILPMAGIETWWVGRGESSEVSYRISFEKESECSVQAFAQLPDGRRLRLIN